MSIVAALYVFANAAYLKVMTVPQIAATERVGAELATRTMGSISGAVISMTVLLSIIGAVNGCILTSARVPFAQAAGDLLTAGVLELTCLEFGSPRGTLFLNGFGESGFEPTLGVTNRVALLPSRQPVGFSFQRPDSDSEDTGTGIPKGNGEARELRRGPGCSVIGGTKQFSSGLDRILGNHLYIPRVLPNPDLIPIADAGLGPLLTRGFL
jgi:hypothetical protein